MTGGEGSRVALGFESCAAVEFNFLESVFGLRIMARNETRVRYESTTRFVNVFHGSFSYEIGVELGRWVTIDGVSVEQSFPIQSILSMCNQGRQLDKALTATTSAQVVLSLKRLARLTSKYARSLLADGDALFEELSTANAKWSQEYLEGIRASRLRATADEAWQHGDLRAVTLAYTEIDSELDKISLRPSERARLQYAQKHGDRE